VCAHILYSTFGLGLWGVSSILVPLGLSNRQARCYRQHLLAVTRDDDACVLGYGYISKGGIWLFGAEVKHKDTEWNKSEMQWLKH